MSTPFKMKGFSGFRNSPAKHRKGGEWTGHKHKTKLGKLTGIIAEGIKGYHRNPDIFQGYEPTPGNYIGISKDRGFAARLTNKDNRELFSTYRNHPSSANFDPDKKIGKRTTKLFGHEIKPLSRKEQQKKSKARKKKFGHFGTTGI